jgi:hypothetical protein
VARACPQGVVEVLCGLIVHTLADPAA